MKRVMRKWKQAISMLLVAAMIITMVPQTSLEAQAAQMDLSEEASTETSVEETIGFEEAAGSEETTEPAETSVSEETAGSEETTESEETAGSEETAESEETASSEETAESEETTSSEETVEAEETTVSEETVETEEETLTEEITGDGDIANDSSSESYAVTVSGNNAEVSFTNECVKENAVEKGTDVTFTVAPETGFVVSEVSYKVGTEGNENVLTAEDGVYTIVNTAITDAVEIIVKTQKIEYTVNFSVTDATVEIEEKEVTSVNVAYGDSVAFRVTPKEGYELEYVSTTDSEEGALTANEEGNYTFTPNAENTTDKVATIYVKAEKPTNVVTLTVSGNNAAYTATVSGNDVLTDTYKAGDELVTTGDEIALSIVAAAGYSVEKVIAIYKEEGAEKETEQVITPESDGDYKINFAQTARLVEVKVYAPTKAIEEEKTITFHNKAAHMTYEVAANKNIVKVDGKNNTYKLATGTQNVEFSVTATGKFAPVVYVDGKELKATGSTQKTVKKVKYTTYSYTVAAGAFVNSPVVTIEEEAEKKIVSVSYDETEVNVYAKLGGKVIYDCGIEDGVVYYEVETDSKLVVVAAPKTNCNITGATLAVGSTAAKNVKTKAAGCEITVAATDNAELTISSKGLYTANLKKADGTALTAAKNVYTADYKEEYTTAAIYGVDTEVVLSKVEVLDKKNAAKTTAVLAEDGKTAKIAINKEEAGKKLTVNLYTKDGESDVKIASYSLNVLPVLTKVSVTGVKNGKVTQTVDTVAEYAITSTPKTADISILDVVVTSAKENATQEDIEAAQKAVQAAIVNGKLVITTAVAKEATPDAAKVTIIDKTVDKTVEGYTAGDEIVDGGVIVVSTAEPTALTGKTPGVKVTASDDTTLTLALSSDKKIAVPSVGAVYYKVEVAPQEVEGKEIPETITEATKAPFYIIRNGVSQNETITVNKAGYGKGEEWKYDIKVTLVQTTDKELLSTENEADKTAFSSQSKEVKNAATKAPYYETKLTLKKKATTVYTGQQNVIVATPVFGKNTTYKAVNAYWEPDYYEQDDYWLSVSVNENKEIVVSVDEEAEPGKYKIVVEAETTATMKPATATITINVVQGIYDLDFGTPDYEYEDDDDNYAVMNLYKAEKKAASVNLPTVIYNDGDSSYAPKTKKVTWKVLNYDYDEFSEDDSLYGMVTIKNGKVVVNKNYVLTGDYTEDTFVLEATAADYKGNETYERIDVTLTAEKTEIGELAIMRAVMYTPNQVTYELLGKNGTTVTADLLEDGDVFVVSMKKGAIEKDSYTFEELCENMVAGPESIANQVTFKSSNKAVKIDANGTISASKPVKNVTITATMKDGGKSSAKLKGFAVDYAKAEELGLEISLGQIFGSPKPYDMDVRDIRFKGTTNSLFSVQVKQRAGEGWQALKGLTNFKLSVSGGKIVDIGDMAEYGYYYIQANKGNVTITLEDKANGETKVYTLTNEAYSDAKAPKVSTKDKLVAGIHEGSQTITFKVSGNYDFKNKYVMAEVDMAELYKSFSGMMSSDMSNMEYQMMSMHLFSLTSETMIVPVKEDGTFSINFDVSEMTGEESTFSYLLAGKYKFHFTFGTVDENGNFIADAKPVSTTLKAVAQTKKASFKPVTTYTMSAKDNAVVEMTAKSQGILLYQYRALENANINGKENKFTDYFEIEEEIQSNNFIPQYKYFLKLKSGVDVTQITKDDLTGYVEYNAGTVEGKTISGTAKITVNLKDVVGKYAADKVSVLEADEMKANVAVTRDKEAIKVAHACAEEGKFTATVSGNGDFVELTSKGENKATVGKNNVTMYVVAEDSYYKEKVDTLAEAVVTANEEEKAAAVKAYEDAVKEYGIKVTTTVTVVKNDKTGKIKIDRKQLKQTFTAEQYADVEQNYFVNVPYTKKVACNITEITNNSIKVGDASLINFNCITGKDGKNYIEISVNKNVLQQAVKDELVTYGKKLTVKATLGFGEGVATESFTFTLMLPKAAEMTYAQAVEKVTASVVDIEGKIVPEYWEGITEEEIFSAKYAVCEEVMKLLAGDSDTIVLAEDDPNFVFDKEIAAPVYVAPNSREAGSLAVTVRLADGTTIHSDNKVYTDVTFQLTIPKTLKTASELRAEINTWIDAHRNNYVTNEMTADDIAADMRKELEIPSHLRVVVSENSSNKATETSDGSISISVQVLDIQNGEVIDCGQYSLSIAKLATS